MVNRISRVVYRVRLCKQKEKGRKKAVGRVAAQSLARASELGPVQSKARRGEARRGELEIAIKITNVIANRRRVLKHREHT